MADGVMVVVGGSRGIGAAIARKAAAQGYEVVFSYASARDTAEELAASIAADGGKAHAVQADTASETDILALFEAAARHGQITAMVFSAGITGPASSVADVTAETLTKVIQVNLVGAMLCGREAVRNMSTERGGKGGAVVFLSSRATQFGSANEYVWYAASKGGMDSFAIGLAKEVAEQGIRVNCVSPGPVATDMLSPARQELGASRVPMQRIGQPEEIADAVLYLASDAASYITAANLSVSGGV